MALFQPFSDLPGIDVEGCGNFDSAPSDTPYLSMNSAWPSLDPTLDFCRYADDYENNHSFNHVRNLHEQLVELEQSANGYGNHSLPLQISHPSFARQEIYPSWNIPHDRYRSGYMSPHGHMGRSLSSTDSSPSECAWSPDYARGYQNLAVVSHMGQPAYPSPTSQYSTVSHQGSWTQQHMYTGYAPQSPTPTTHMSACMRDIQLAPDGVMEMDLENNDTVQVRINAPEELILSPEHASPADSGLGMSVYDTGSVGDEEEEEEDDDGAQESDNDSELYPPGAVRKQSMNEKRPLVGHSPKRTRSLNNPIVNNVVADPKARITKSTNRKNARSISSKKSSSKNADKYKRFPCTFSRYGCDSKFASKNEWKRHVATQHMQLGVYRCDVGFCNTDRDHAHASQGLVPVANRVYNDFNRKDLFTQHHRRLHTPWGKTREPSKQEVEKFDASLEAVRQRCWTVHREAPSRSCCGFCDLVFEGTGTDRGGIRVHSWDERMEHVGKHFETNDWDAEAEKEDEDLSAWAIREGLVKDWGSRGKWLVQIEPRSLVVQSPEDGKRGGRRSRRNTKNLNDVAVVVVDEDAQGESE